MHEYVFGNLTKFVRFSSMFVKRTQPWIEP